MKRRIRNTAWVLPVFVLIICGSPSLVLAGDAKPRQPSATRASPGQPEGAREKIEMQGTGRAMATMTEELVVSRRPLGQGDSFRSIESALEHASANGLRMIRVTVHPGRYSGDLQITRPTTINGTNPSAVFVQGSISNPDGHRLTLSNLRIHDCGPHALMQRGGSLTLTDFKVSGTRSAAGDPESGIAIDVAGGLVGRFTNVTLDSNQGGALRVSGRGTAVTAFRLSATNNRIFRSARSGARSSPALASLPIGRSDLGNAIGGLRPLRIGHLFDDGPARMQAAAAEAPAHEVKRKRKAPPMRQAPGGSLLRRGGRPETRHKSAVEVAEGAVLLAMNPVVENNEFIGVLVRNEGRAHLASGRVSRTREVPELGSQAGGINVTARNRSRLELRNMWIAHADLAGVQNVGSWVKATDSIIEHNRIGANLQGDMEPGYEAWDCLLQGETVFRNNERDFDSDRLPVPDPALPDDWLQDGGGQPSGQQGTDCPGVPWETGR